MSHEAALNAISGAVSESSFLATKELAYHVTASKDAKNHVISAADNLISLLAKAINVATGDTVAETENALDSIGEVTDKLLEKTDFYLDMAKRNANSSLLSTTDPVVKSGRNPSSQPASFVSSKSAPIIRPQLAFTDIIDNSNSTPFIRKLAVKHNAKQPLDHAMPSSGQLPPGMAEHITQSLGVTSATSSAFSLAHPYEFEISTLEYPDKAMQFRPEVLYEGMDKTPLTYVDTTEKFNEMLIVLEGVDEVAIDLEHHDYRSFQGFTCLIQISTRKEDFLIDALLLRNHLPNLNRITSNPGILKVFHGAEMDVLWLQRDFGCYIVGLFDTYHAARVLELEAAGLGHLLKYYCGVETNKKYQLADWRIRPLPKEMLKYARMDTHYLLYIYDRMRNELLQKTPDAIETKQYLRVVLQRSETTCLKVYEKEVYDAVNGEGPNGWQNHLRKSSIALTPIQISIFKALHAWRDHTARIEDESVRYVTPTHMLHIIAAQQPKDYKSLVGCCHPLVPNLLKVYAQDVLRIVESVRLAGEEAFRIKDLEARKIVEENGGGGEKESLMHAEPTHLRFTEDSDLETLAAIPQNPKDNNKPALKKSSALTSQKKNTTLFSKVKTNIVVSWKSVGGVTNDGQHSALATFLTCEPSSTEFSALKEAESIRASLYLVPPSFAKKRKAEDSASDLAKPKLKKSTISEKQSVPAVTMESVVAVAKRGKSSGGAGIQETVTETIKALETASKAGASEGRVSASIPALPGNTYVYPVEAAGESGNGHVGDDNEKKVFNPYGQLASEVVGYRGFSQGAKGSKGKSSSFQK